MQMETDEIKLGTELHSKFQDENVTTVFNQCCANDEIFDIIEKRCMAGKNEAYNKYTSKTNDLTLGNYKRYHDNRFPLYYSCF